jgi:hypothetical protein
MYDIYHCTGKDRVRFALRRGGKRMLFAIGLIPALQHRKNLIQSWRG